MSARGGVVKTVSGSVKTVLGTTRELSLAVCIIYGILRYAQNDKNANVVSAREKYFQENFSRKRNNRPKKEPYKKYGE